MGYEYDDGDGGKDSYLRKVANLYEDSRGEKFAHVHWFERGADTILMDAAEEKEAFQVLYCDNVPLANIQCKASVTFWPLPSSTKAWAATGGSEAAAESVAPMPKELEEEVDEKNVFFYRMR